MVVVDFVVVDDFVVVVDFVFVVVDDDGYWGERIEKYHCLNFYTFERQASLTAEDSNAGDLLEQCCDMRHACMHVCGTTKKKCDAQFKKCT